MAKFRAPYLYTETRLNLDQGYIGSTVEITLPNNNPAAFGSVQPVHRQVLNDVKVGSDEATFTRDHLATEGSVYFRRDERYPRSFLWRLLDDRRALEIQSVDLSQDENEKTEALLTLLLRFPAAIRPFCIAFGDPDERDALNVFAITTTNELWTLTLHRDFFVHLHSTEALTMEWCKTTTPSIFTASSPYRLSATSARELFVSMADGGIARLTRQAGQDGSHWHDIFYSEEHWSSTLTRPLQIWKSVKKVQYEDLDLHTSVAMSVGLSAADDSDSQHLVTVCMNHKLRIWNLKTGKITLERDILDEDTSERPNHTEYLMGPTQRQLLQVFDMPGRNEYCVVTYSPKQHQFKFWAVLDGDEQQHGIRQMRSEIDYTPPIDDLMDTSVWNLEEFYLRPSRGTRQTELWIRVRSGAISQVFRIEFDPFDWGHKHHETTDATMRDWEEGWVTVTPGRQTVEFLDTLAPSEAVLKGSNLQTPSVVDEWLGFLLYPGRFTIPTLETALQVYNKAVKRTVSSAALKTPLKGRIASAISANIPRSRPGEERPVSQWQTFYGLVRDLHKRRGDALSFAVDPWDQLPWVVTSDMASPIRTCTELELCQLNRSITEKVADPEVILSDPDKNDGSQIGILLRLASDFRSGLSPEFQIVFKRAVLADLQDESILSVSDQIHNLQERISLRDQVTEEDFEMISEAVEAVGGYSIFANENFHRILDTLLQAITGREQDELITRFGVKSLMRTTQEIIALNTEVLLDLLAILLFIEDEFEPEDLLESVTGSRNPPAKDLDAMEDDSDSAVGERTFDAGELLVELVKSLRDHEILQFLTTRQRQEGRKSRHRLGPASASTNSSSIPDTTYTCTLLESMFVGDWSQLKCHEDISIPAEITYLARAWITNLDIAQYDNFTAHVLADLIKHRNLKLAKEFLPLVPVTGWSSYLRGRLYLATGEYAECSTWFKKASYPMSIPYFDINTCDTGELVRLDEHDSFSTGLTSYYSHISELLSQAKATSYVADFAKLALQNHGLEASIDPETRDYRIFDEAQIIEREKKQSDILSRLFTASLQTHRYDEAYSALTRMPPTGVRHFSLQSFITTLVTENRVDLLLSYPFATLSSEADDVLAAMTKKTLNLNAHPQYHKVLYAFRINRENYRGAAQCAFERLERLKGDSEVTRDPEDQRLVQAYLLLINTLVCVGRDEAWVIKEADVVGHVNGNAGGKRNGVDGAPPVKKERRRLVTLDDIRREYQEELDRLAALEQGKFAFADDGGEGMDVL
ncbi:hypothetical protein EJ08DRAFT_313194 [Tothia fuscella]|uniref:Uncharacterized protein n=1 Tax=Tothia fuscella TaxID=1048955 RepID=A0A9P4NP52_9PEZI|nr:hypothetical protein EJ08DRAFT_313194 [Tothia fuscella]